MPQIYRYELTVPEDALDENGHVNNVEYLRWMLDAAVSAFRLSGMHSSYKGCRRDLGSANTSD